MTSTELTILWVYGVIVAIWPIRQLVLWYAFQRIDVLTTLSPRFTGTRPPIVTVMIPARNEEAAIADCLASVCAQTYSNLEIIVIDDRSTDRTAEIANEFAAKDSRVRLLSITDLPPGWTGKTHALQTAADQANGEWYWFLDCDTHHSPENLDIVMEYTRLKRAEMSSLILELRCETFWEELIQPLAGIVLMQSFPLFRVNNDKDRLAFANGQYILVSREAYRAAGGHRSVRDRFVEDIYFAKQMKSVRRPIRVAVARGIGSTRMYSSLDGIVRGWSRILYDALGRSPIRLIGRLLDPIVFSQTGHLALLATLILLLFGKHDRFVLILGGLAVVHHILNYFVLQQVYRMSVPNSKAMKWYPVANVVIEWILVRAIRMCLTGQVDWRGTSYGTPRTTQGKAK
ncbi:glycosyltransferase [Singulisphaera sp. PoT]|uniref:glycosyltransferase n=1 Tax=Singulisphaera sp. PoT TaxID=3411797 RepID=UPI003BF6129E